MSIRNLILALAFILPVSSASAQSNDGVDGSEAEAEAEPSARELFEEGQRAYEAGRYAETAELWQRAYALDPRPLLQFNLAQAYERLGRLSEARDAYVAYLESSPDSTEQRLLAEARAASLRERIAQTGVVLTGGPEGAAVLIDGEDMGRLPHPDPFPLAAGSHQVEVRAAGYETFRSTVAIPEGESTELPITMDASSGGGGGGVSMIGVGVAAAGGALLIGGAITGGLALSSASSAPASEGDEADLARGLALATDVMIPIGVAAAATGVALMFVLGGDESGDQAVLPWFSPGGAGVSATRRF